MGGGLMMASGNDKTFVGGISSSDGLLDRWKQMVYAASRMSGYKTTAEEVRKVAGNSGVELSEDEVLDILSANDENAKER
jgi:type IV secretory pathway TrbL component